MVGVMVTCLLCLSVYEHLSLHLMAIFPGELAGFIVAKDDGGVVVSAGAITCEKLQSNRRHQQTSTRLFTGRMPFLSPNQQCQSTEGNLCIC